MQFLTIPITVALTLGLLSCKSDNPIPEPDPFVIVDDRLTPVPGTILLPKQVLEIASARAKAESFNPTEYRKGPIMWSPTQKQWSVLFNHIPSRYFGDHFMIQVNDQDSTTRFVAGM